MECSKRSSHWEVYSNKERSEVNNLTLDLTELEKEQTKPQVN